MKHPIILIVAILIVAAAGGMIIKHTLEIQNAIQENERRSLRIPEERNLPTAPARSVDRPMLAFELPQRESEVSSLAPPATRSLWRKAIGWDFVFLLGYILLLASLPFAGEEDDHERTIWESVVFLVLVTGFADVLENTAQLIVLHDLDRGTRLAGTNAYTALPILGATKWFFFFLTCAALGLVVSATSVLLLALCIARIVRQTPGPRAEGDVTHSDTIRVRRETGG